MSTSAVGSCVLHDSVGGICPGSSFAVYIYGTAVWAPCERGMRGSTVCPSRAVARSHPAPRLCGFTNHEKQIQKNIQSAIRPPSALTSHVSVASGRMSCSTRRACSGYLRHSPAHTWSNCKIHPPQGYMIFGDHGAEEPGTSVKVDAWLNPRFVRAATENHERSS